MGKKGKKKDPEKKFALSAAKEAKADKKAQKRLQKQARREAEQKGEAHIDGESSNHHGDGDDDIDALLEQYKKQSLELTTPLVEILGDDSGINTDNTTNPSFPYPPRGNFTLTLCPTSNDLYMFGGEYFNGVENLVFDELLCWSPDAKPDTEDDEVKKNHTTGIWKRITSPTRPPQRCSHTTVYYNNALYVFGGELATAQNYHHYKDIWKFDIKTNLWTEIKPRNKGGPSTRSGHRSIVYRHYMIVFGGFFEAARDAPRWFNDLYVFDFATNQWTECKYSKLATIPPERSAFNFGMTNGSDIAYLSGGYSKLKNPAPGTKAEGRVFSDCWSLNLKGLPEKTPTWEKISRKGEYPSQRSGTACSVWKNKLLVFGGVEDEETDNHRVNSVFFDDLFAFDMDRKRWFKLNLKKKAGERRRRRKGNDDNQEEEESQALQVDNKSSDEEEGIEGEAVSSGWDLDMLKSNMFAFIDGDGNVVYEKIEDSDDEQEKKGDVIMEEDTGYEADTGPKKQSSPTKGRELKDTSESQLGNDVVKKMEAPEPTASVPVAKSEVMAVGKDGSPEAVSRQTPLPRIKAQIIVRGNTLFLYGGILEVGDREVTLDDLWSIDLQKREEWVCIHPGSMHKQVWKGVESDNESYYSTDRGTGGNESDDEEDFGEFDDIVEEGEDEEAIMAARKAAKKAAKKEKMKGIREEIKSLNDKLSLGDPNGTPQIGEELADFYSRTSMYWTEKAMAAVSGDASSADDVTVKELKREGFNLAQERYEEVKPILTRLGELEDSQKESEDRKEKKKSKKDKKSKKEKKDKRR